MNHIENVRIGQWIIITSDNAHHDLLGQLKDNPWLLLQAPKIRYLGIPCKVLAKSAPYILLENNGSRSVIDTRYISWTVADKRYVREFMKIDCPSESIKVEESEFGNRTKPPLCPRCEIAMRQHQVSDGPMILVCDKCGGEFV